MNELIHADIFFFVTTIVVVIFGVGAAVVLYFLILILRDIVAVVKKVRKASDELEQDFENLRTNIKGEGVRVKTVFELALAFLARHIPKARANKKKKENTNTRSE